MDSWEGEERSSTILLKEATQKSRSVDESGKEEMKKEIGV